MAYRNGQLPAEALVEVEPGNFLERHTARQYRAMDAAFHEDTGFHLAIADPAGAYRSRFTQGDMRREWFAGHIPGKYGFSRTSTVPPAPEGESNHGFGVCVDIAVGAPWVLEHGHKFGFDQVLGRADPNHFQYNGRTVTAGFETHPIHRPEDNTMATFKAKNYYGIGFDDVEQISRDEAASIQKLNGGGDVVHVSSAAAKLLIAGANRRRLRRIEDQALAVGRVLSAADKRAITASFVTGDDEDGSADPDGV